MCKDDLGVHCMSQQGGDLHGFVSEMSLFSVSEQQVTGGNAALEALLC